MTMGLATMFAAVITSGIGITWVAWPVRTVTFCRWYHRKKPIWIQELRLAGLVMRPWMPTYFRIMGVVLCLAALGLGWIGTTE